MTEDVVVKIAWPEVGVHYHPESPEAEPPDQLAAVELAAHRLVLRAIELRDRLGTFSLLRQYASQQQAGIGVAGIRLDNLMQQPNGLGSLALCQKIPRLFNRRTLRQQDGCAGHRGQTPSLHVRLPLNFRTPVMPDPSVT